VLLLALLKIKYLRTRPYTPKTNGKAERFVQTSLREWAYAHAYASSDERAKELPTWLARYNCLRPHASLGSMPPISRIGPTGNTLLRHHTSRISKGCSGSLSIARRAMEEMMAARAPSVKRYVVRLSAEERRELEAMIRKGKSPALRLVKARILLKADLSEAGEGWSNSRIVEALETSLSMVYRARNSPIC
jgi:hypothetical protein